MTVRLGVLVAALVVGAQWLVVGSFISQGYTTWVKEHDPITTVGLQTTAVLSVASLLAVVFSIWAYDHLHRQRAATRFGALTVALTGLSGLLVFWGTIGAGLVHVISR
jgi:hypothetical protein